MSRTICTNPQPVSACSLRALQALRYSPHGLVEQVVGSSGRRNIPWECIYCLLDQDRTVIHETCLEPPGRPLLIRFVLTLFATISIAWAGDPDKVVHAINDIDSWQQEGQQPCEMSWTQREENPHTLVDFEDLSGWTLELDGGAAGEFRRSREQQM